MALLEIQNLKAHFHTRKGIIKAVNGISYSINPGETLGIVGESGSGKSVSQLSYLGLLPRPPLNIPEGKVLYRGEDLLTCGEERLRKIRGNKISMIFQEPMTSLNPYLTIGTQLIEPLMLHRGRTKKLALKEACEALERVGIPGAEKAMRVYPHEFSGGMRQRVMIAMALTTQPEVLIADEPTTALDVTVQAQILDLLKSIQKETQMAVLLITHDLGVVAGIADRMVVMYAGRVFEEGPVETLFEKSAHPYTKALLKSTPRIDLVQETIPVIGGSIPDLSQLKSGCPFYDRCEFRKPVCENEFPPPRYLTPTLGDGGHGGHGGNFANLSAKHQTFCHVENI
jgi:oligopeptide transport system ATP-binding protein